MITGDLDAALSTLAQRGSTPAAPTWRPAPGEAYATPLPFRLAKAEGGNPASVAARLAGQLRQLDWIASAASTGPGFLTVTVTACALAGLAVRIPQAGVACARSRALAGVTFPAPAPADLKSAPTWQRARQLLTTTAVARLARAAGADVTATHVDGTKRSGPRRPPPASEPTVVASAMAYAGADAVIYTLARLPAHAPAQLDARLAAAHHLGNPAYAVRYARAHAASAQRQAATLGLRLGEAPALELLGHPRERSLLYQLSWLPERAGEAARREQLDVLTRYLETVADAYLGCQEHCPAVPPGVPGTPGARELTVARLWLAAAADTVLRTGLGLLGVAAPERL